MNAIYIYPDDQQAEDAIVKVLDMLTQGEEFELHTEASPPWMRVVAGDPQRMVEVIRSFGVRVEVKQE